MSFGNLLAVSVLGFAAPLLATLVGRLRVSSVVLEIVLGILVGPSGLGWVHVDAPVTVVSTLGLAMLLFLAGLEVDVERLQGRVLELVATSMLLSLGVAAGVGFGLDAIGVSQAPVLVAVTLAATSLGLIVPILKDSGNAEGEFGQLVIAGAMVAEFSTIILLSLLFSRESSGLGARIVLLGAFTVAGVAIAVGLLRVGEAGRVERVFLRLQDTTAQIRIRFALVLCIAFTALAGRLGLETILGAFVAGALLRIIDRDVMTSHPLMGAKLDAIGFGFLVPAFFVTSGLRFNLGALFASGSTLARVPLFLAALLVIRALPAVLYRPLVVGRRLVAVGLLQATSLSFIVAATQIGLELRLIPQATAAALVAAGLLSVVLFPPIALALMASAARGAGPGEALDTAEADAATAAAAPAPRD